MPVQTFEAITDANGNVRFADTVRLPAHTKVYVLVPEQTTPYAEIVLATDELPASSLRFPLVRVMEEGLAKRLVKTVIEDADAKL